MDHRSGSRVRRRLRSLAWLELLNVPLQAWIWFGVVGWPVTSANLAGFGLFVLVLVEGAGYWWAKLQQLATGCAPLPGAGAFSVARAANVPLLGVGLLFIAWRAVTDPGAGSWPGMAFGLFAVLEHVNYFHVQLMYDTAADRRHLRSHGLRRAHLARDLDVWHRSSHVEKTPLNP
ncbi:hypothetical protein LO762_25765 [Actinocorallia sp. API 0066]|uniref:hypothetical protein n=1 Tax=Actinocorallia sp. API 0066 TaxID=2896846 RepID=UPI001E3E5678|nr:hypothetical protein [Actinocorallia sp. API 0066]MCD0452564.1 hypothetical protein [Actinocorallia sp. API 0066]